MKMCKSIGVEGSVERQTNAESDGRKSAGNLDVVIAELGEFSLQSIKTFAIISIPTALATTLLVNFIFTAAILDYRCRVPQCESVISSNQSIIEQIIPLNSDNKIKKCLQYNETSTISTDINRNECNLGAFNRSETIECSEFVFKGDEHRLSHEFHLVCDNEYKLTLVGVANNIGRFVSLPISGYFSDRFGRLTLLIWGIVASSVAGILQAFSINFEMFILMEFLVACCCTGILSAGFILTAEWITTKYRVLMLFFLGCANPMASTLMSLAAMYLASNFTLYLVVIFTPGLLMWVIYWLIDESPRWMISVGRHEKAEQILQKRARACGKVLSPYAMYTVRSLCARNEQDQKDNTKNGTTFQQIASVFSSGPLLLRFLLLSSCWIVNSFVYYGLQLSSVQIANDSNKYVSFIIIQWAELPGMVLGYLLLDRIGRRWTLLVSLILCGLAVLSSPILNGNEDFKRLVLVMFVVGKCAISSSFMSIYIYTTELWPTASRNTMMALCSMIGRIGGMLASVTILLGPTIPAYLFAGAALYAAVIILLLPETLNRKLPDTIDEIRKN